MNWQKLEHPHKRILVVEKDSEIAWLVQEMLTTRGHSVELVPDTEACLSRFSSFRPDLVLLSPGLPGTGGWELLEQVREKGLLRRVRVALLTTNPFIREELARRGLGDKVDYIRQPFTTGDLLRTVEAAC